MTPAWYPVVSVLLADDPAMVPPVAKMTVRGSDLFVSSYTRQSFSPAGSDVRVVGRLVGHVESVRSGERAVVVAGDNDRRGRGQQGRRQGKRQRRKGQGEHADCFRMCLALGRKGRAEKGVGVLITSSHALYIPFPAMSVRSTRHALSCRATPSAVVRCSPEQGWTPESARVRRANNCHVRRCTSAALSPDHWGI